MERWQREAKHKAQVVAGARKRRRKLEQQRDEKQTR
jgi:hypothetical protein